MGVRNYFWVAMVVDYVYSNTLDRKSAVASPMSTTSTTTVTNSEGSTTAITTSGNPYLFGGKEWHTTFGLDTYDFSARHYSPQLARFLTPDPLTPSYPSLSPYSYCAANPISLIDPTGMAWEVVENGENEPLGYNWIDPEFSSDENGNLLPGLYERAIFFTRKGKNGRTFNAESNTNIGTSIAYVFCEDGTIKMYDACTYPSDLDKYPTIPEGYYEAMVGKHKGSYEALRMNDVGRTDYGYTQIELGFPNPSNPKKTPQMELIFIRRVEIMQQKMELFQPAVC